MKCRQCGEEIKGKVWDIRGLKVCEYCHWNYYNEEDNAPTKWSDDHIDF